MTAVAEALVEALETLELSSGLTRDAAEELMDRIATILQGAEKQERSALQEAVRRRFNAANEEQAEEALIDFYESFPEIFLGEETEEGEEPEIEE